MRRGWQRTWQSDPQARLEEFQEGPTAGHREIIGCATPQDTSKDTYFTLIILEMREKGKLI